MGAIRWVLSFFGGAALLYLLLFIFFFLIGGVALIFGFSLGSIDAWLDSRSSWISAAGDILFRLVCLLFLLLCVGTIGLGLWQRVAGSRQNRTALARAPAPGQAGAAAEERIGWGAMIAALVIGYFLYFGAFVDT